MTNKNLRAGVALTVLILCLAFYILTPASTAEAGGGGASGATMQQVEQRGLTPQEKRGKAVYLRGESASGSEMTAMVGELDVPSSTVTCAGCHGLRGEGKTEGGVVSGNLTWSDLTKSSGHTEPTGRKHGPFDERSFARAVMEGVDPAGNNLLAAMPRYKMSSEDMADLIAYLKRIEGEGEPGVSETSVKVVTMLPLKGPLAEQGAAMRDVLTAYFDDVNSRGGIYNRKLELRVAETDADRATTTARIQQMIKGEQAFALVGGISAGADKELGALVRAEEIPAIGPSTLIPLVDVGDNRNLFYLLPGVREQARALANFAAARTDLRRGGVAVVAVAENELAGAAADAVEEQTKRAGWPAVTRQTYQRGQFDAAQMAQALKKSGAEAIFFFGTSGDETSFIREAAAADWTPTVLLLGALAGRDLQASVTAPFKDKIFLAFPTVPADVTPAGMVEFRALVERYKFAPRHTASQLSALAAAKVFVEGLKRAGKDLSREKLVAALEGLSDFETGITPRITFGPKRRVGAAGTYVVTLDPERKDFTVVEWVKAY